MGEIFSGGEIAIINIFGVAIPCGILSDGAQASNSQIQRSLFVFATVITM